MKFFACIALLAVFGAASASLASDLAPLAWLLGPLTNGLGSGLQHAAGNIKAAGNNVGAGLHQVANGVGVVAANTAAGVGEAAKMLPAGLVRTVHAIDHSPGIVGAADKAIAGN